MHARYTASAPRLTPAILTVILLGTGVALAEPPAELLARGDAAWSRRADGHQEGRADGGKIGEAVSAYKHALELSPTSIGIRERLLQALYFKGMFATDGEAAQRSIYAEGRDCAEAGIELLATELGHGEGFVSSSTEGIAAAVAARPESAALFFWAAAHWGLWAESSGVFAAARQGVAGRIRDYARIVNLVDEGYEGGGGRRILGRLHSQAPRIPFITGWVDRDAALSNLERALTLAPRNRWNRLYLADALLRFRPRRRAEAEAMLERLIAEPPSADLLQDLRIQRDARRLVAEIDGG